MVKPGIRSSWRDLALAWALPLSASVALILIIGSCAKLALADPCGDVNRSGTTNSVDANEIQRSLVPLPPITRFDERWCDVTSNERCNVVDAQQIQMNQLDPNQWPLDCPERELEVRWLQNDPSAVDTYTLELEHGDVRSMSWDASETPVGADGVHRRIVWAFWPQRLTLYASNEAGTSEPSNSIEVGEP